MSSPGGHTVQCASRNPLIIEQWIDEWIPLLGAPGYPPLITYINPCWDSHGDPDWPADSRTIGCSLQIPPGLSGATILERLASTISESASWWKSNAQGKWSDAPVMSLARAEDKIHGVHLIRGNESVCGEESGIWSGNIAIVTCDQCREQAGIRDETV